MARTAQMKVVDGVDARDRRFVGDLIERIVAECPKRRATSASERRAQEMLQEVLQGRGFDSELVPFRYNDDLYTTLALHFGLGTLGSSLFAVAPAVSLALHATAAISYHGDSAHRFYLLRRLQQWQESQNLVCTLPAEGEPALRIVVLAHADAAPTGWMFHPWFLQRLGGPPPRGLRWLLGKPLKTATYSQYLLAYLDLLGLLLGPARLALLPAVAAASIPGLIATVLNGQIALADDVVPGATDDLSGCAALPLLATRMAPRKPADVELVFVATGCEEAGRGGAMNLARQRRDEWGRENTVILGLDGLANGDLTWLVEGEVVRHPTPTWLHDALQSVARSEPRWHDVGPFEVPAGGSDVAAFLGAGYEGTCLACIDLELETPRNYHVHTDTPENVDLVQVLSCVDFAEKLVDEIIRRRTSHPGLG